jgi:release factor glutamine methyltransferase
MTTSIQELLQQGQAQLVESSDSARLDAEILLGHVLSKGRAFLYANAERGITEPYTSDFHSLLKQRAQHVPVAYLTGEWEFWSLSLQVTPDVLVPRPETELLVELTLEHLPAGQNSRLLELGTGSGAIAIALATERPDCDIVATDLSPEALAIAAANATRHCPERISFVVGEWFNPLLTKSFDVIVSNPPYVATGHPEQTDPDIIHEPAGALYSGSDGLDDIRQIIGAAPSHLNSNGWLLLEHGFDQATQIQQRMRAAGLTSVSTTNDFSGQPRVTYGCMPE